MISCRLFRAKSAEAVVVVDMNNVMPSKVVFPTGSRPHFMRLNDVEQAIFNSTMSLSMFNWSTNVIQSHEVLNIGLSWWLCDIKIIELCEYFEAEKESPVYSDDESRNLLFLTPVIPYPPDIEYNSDSDSLPELEEIEPPSSPLTGQDLATADEELAG